MEQSRIDQFKSWLDRHKEQKSALRLLVQGYLLLSVLCFLILALPISRNESISFVDQIFLSISIVSTTGLSPVNFGDTFTFFGELITLFFIQFGGIGYMALSSFIILKSNAKLPKISIKLLRLEFNLPSRYPLLSFIKSIFVFTVLIELIGSVFLYFGFKEAGVNNPLWAALFHSVSAFCTAGFSLFGDSLTSFQDNALISNTILILSILGSVGFIVLLDFWLKLIGKRKHVTLTSKIILVSTVVYIVIGTLLLYISGGLLIGDGFEGFKVAFFQLVSAHTTVGFNNFDLANLGQGGVLILIVFMVIGASPAGTGGGIKTTSITALFGLLYSILKQRKHITFFKKEIPKQRILLAVATTVFYISILLIGTWILVQRNSEKFPFESILFEVSSALSTVGLSTGITAELCGFSKIVLSFLMFIGRLGVMTFGFALISKSPIIRLKPKVEDIAV